jgi:hypothetical protein
MKASYAYYRVGQYTKFAGYEKARQSRVYFCGEHTSNDFQGFMEGGASEGERPRAPARRDPLRAPARRDGLRAAPARAPPRAVARRRLIPQRMR